MRSLYTFLWIVGGIVAGGALLARAQDPPSHPRGVDRQLSREIDDLEASIRREDANLRQQKAEIERARAAADRLQAEAKDVAQRWGADSPAARSANTAAAQAHSRLMHTISAKDHTAFRMSVLERSVRADRSLLSTPIATGAPAGSQSVE